MTMTDPRLLSAINSLNDALNLVREIHEESKPIPIGNIERHKLVERLDVLFDLGQDHYDPELGNCKMFTNGDHKYCGFSEQEIKNIRSLILRDRPDDNLIRQGSMVYNPNEYKIIDLHKGEEKSPWSTDIDAAPLGEIVWVVVHGSYRCGYRILKANGQHVWADTDGNQIKISAWMKIIPLPEGK